jgi:maltooligosyltrehalose trehalohydrolase
MSAAEPRRRLPVGAEVLADGNVHFRVWAPRRRRVEVALESSNRTEALTPEANGYFSARVKCPAGELYRFRLDGEPNLYPDPASRFQPAGPHGQSQVIDPHGFRWTDHSWPGVSLSGQVIYEMHIGTFTREGTWEAAGRELPELAATGITLLEVMPVADFPGRFGWGYDGVNLFAPTHLYGMPDDFRRFVDCAHSLGLGVILDVVYNHLGPDGNYLRQFAADYFTDRYTTDWGEAINFDGDNAGPVREFFVANAGYWIDEFHLDGLRLDATQNVYDKSAENILAAIARRVREAGRNRSTFVVAENENQHVKLVQPCDQGGYGLDAVWNDDFHHSAMVAGTGHNEAYYIDFRGTVQELISTVKWGYLYQGQRYLWQKKRRGTPSLDLPPSRFVNYIQNHDQVANSARGLRFHELTSPGRFRALTALLLLAPQTPLLFQGQEFSASSPFYFFADHNPELAKLVRKGRAEFLKQFRSITDPAVLALLPDPASPSSFERCKLDFSERERHAAAYALHRDLLRLRREDAVICCPQARRVDGAVLGPQAFLLRFFGERSNDRLLLVNLGSDLHLEPAPEPLLAPPANAPWELLWSSEHPRYDGSGTPPLDPDGDWRLPGEAALLLKAVTREEKEP